MPNKGFALECIDCKRVSGGCAPTYQQVLLQLYVVFNYKFQLMCQVL